MTLFRIDASIQTEGSATREIGDIVEQEWLAARPGDPVQRRHIGVDVLPADAWGTAVSARDLPDAERTPAQKQAAALAATLVDELLAADALLFTVPLYNYGVSQHFKTYGDLVWTDPRAHGQRFLEGKKAVLVTARGGAYGPGTPREGWDHATPFMRRILADVWGAELTVIEREFTLVGVLPDFDNFTDLAASMRAQAFAAARDAGKALAAA
ncbi:FMN-dependent NADH-azoreductase [Amycolatopsis pithecellobii]|uniref:Flavodoxin family protein n=1 Tax=Amycolatopsis pithecellobii TaxID=664692 RepID=A0A6N7ZAZ4_9PSEU|nr:NAD(P)H-dependent oxidoreductase [Amycolatopsis pithecellobii]MTD58897.1 flavodoxin family protein [Amycolatopsis pithecellobii]